jgi:hypothetical protein
MITLLRDGYGFAAHGRNITFALEAGGMEVEWTLGFTLAEIINGDAAAHITPILDNLQDDLDHLVNSLENRTAVLARKAWEYVAAAPALLAQHSSGSSAASTAVYAVLCVLCYLVLGGYAVSAFMRARSSSSTSSSRGKSGSGCCSGTSNGTATDCCEHSAAPAAAAPVATAVLTDAVPTTTTAACTASVAAQ